MAKDEEKKAKRGWASSSCDRSKMADTDDGALFRFRATCYTPRRFFVPLLKADHGWSVPPESSQALPGRSPWLGGIRGMPATHTMGGRVTWTGFGDG